MHDNLVVDATVEEMENLQAHFAQIIRNRVSENADKKLMISKDAEYTENPMDRENIEESIDVDCVKSWREVLEGAKDNGYSDLEFVRVPVVEESAPQEACFDILVKVLKNEPAASQCTFSCQAGRGRTTLGTLIAKCKKV